MNYPTMTQFGKTTGSNLSEAEFDNMLVAQKDFILQLCNERQTTAAQAALTVVSELWHAHSYSYKIREIQDRIYDEQSTPGWR